MNQIDPGRFNKKIKIVKPNFKEDEYGFTDLDENDSKVLTTFAAVKTTRGYSILMNGDADFEKAYTNFTIRFPKDFPVDRGDIILFKGKRYRIDYPNNVDEADVYLELQAIAVTK